MSARLFIRNDDVWTLDEGFCRFFDLAMERSVPVVHAVIPGKMDQKLVRFLCKAKQKTPHLLDIVQHGWMHINHAKGAGTKYEFGPGRDYKVQGSDIQKGLKKMRRSFGENFTPAFVPPYHGYDENTMKVIEEERFKVFSVGNRVTGFKKSILDLPAQVSFTRYDAGRKYIKKAREVIADLARGIHRRTLSGILMHHADFSTDAYRRELKVFFDSIEALEAKKGWRVLLFSDILKASGNPKERS